MSSSFRLFITIFGGLFGFHKFADKKILQGLLYLFTFGLCFTGWIIDIIIAIQIYTKQKISTIRTTCEFLSIIFALFLSVCCFGSIGTEDYSNTSFFIFLISGITLFKIYVIDNQQINYTIKSNVNKQKIEETVIEENINAEEPKVETQPSEEKIKIINEQPEEELIEEKPEAELIEEPVEETEEEVEEQPEEEIKEEIKTITGEPVNSEIKNHRYDGNDDNLLIEIQYILPSHLLSGKYYNEEELIIDKYKNLKTPKYVLKEIDSIVNNKSGYFYDEEKVIMSDKIKDKYLNYADFYPNGMYWASIDTFDEDQLKWYLYWRKEILNKNVLDTDYGYILAFARELACYTFNHSAPFNISVLEYLYEAYKDLFPDINNYIPSWIQDMISETGYYYNQSDDEIDTIQSNGLLDFLNETQDKEKISITVWRNYYSERNSDLSNKQISLICDDSKYKNKFKKYAGLLAKYYIDEGINIEEKWFCIKIKTKKEYLFRNMNSPIERMQGTFKYKQIDTNEVFDHDMNEITKVCYDLLFPQGEKNEFEYIYENYINGKYELPEGFIKLYFKKKNTKVNDNKIDSINEQVNEPKEFTIDFSKINSNDASVNYVEKNSEKLNLEKDEKEFINIFEDGILDKKIAQQYCIKRGKMLNAYVTNLNEKYYSIINKELITIDEEVLRLNMEMKGD